jgi:hypothetical protein
MSIFWATFCLCKYITFFTILSSFKTWFIVGILRFQKQCDVNVLDFQIELCCRYFGILWLRDSLGYFLKNWAIFSNLLVTLTTIKLEPGIFYQRVFAVQIKSRGAILPPFLYCPEAKFRGFFFFGGGGG